MIDIIREGRDFRTMDTRFYISSCKPIAALNDDVRTTLIKGLN